MNGVDIGHYVIAIGVQQHLVQAVQHAAALQRFAHGFDRLLE
jgi:hypothetical protein